MLPGIYRNRTRIRLYLSAEFATIGFLLWADLHYGWQSRAYTILYVIARAVEVTAIFYVSGFALWAMLFAVLATYGVYLFAGQPWDSNGLILLSEGLCYTLAGLSCWIKRRSAAHTVLSVLWLLLGLFSLGYEAGHWVTLDPVWQSICCIAGFGIIACLPETTN